MNFNQEKIDFIINILEENENLIEENYNQKENLISIGNTLKTKIFSSIDGDEKTNKELVRYAVKEAFELEDRDIIVIQKDKIIIKLMDDEETINTAQDEDAGTIASRYNGINEKDLKSFYDDIFSPDEKECFFDSVAETFVRTQLIGRKLDNKNYEHNVFGLIQTIVTNRLTSLFDSHEEFFKGFSGYIFRIHFKEVFDYISELVLIELSKSNPHIMEFLKYYSLRVVILNGKKYQVPEIIDDNGFKWNVASLMPVIKVYIRASQTYDELEVEIEELNSKISKLYISKVSPVAYNQALNTEVKRLTQSISEDMSKLDRHLGVLKDKSDDAKVKNEIREIRTNLQNCRQEKERLTLKLLPKKQVTQYTELKRDSDTIVRQIKREELTLQRNEKQFLSIKDALTKALTSKKKLSS